MDKKIDSIWDLSEFSNPFRMIAEYSDRGVLTYISSTCANMVGVLRDLPLGSVLRVKVSVKTINQLMGVVFEHISEDDAKPLTRKCVVNKKTFHVRTELVGPLTQTHILDVRCDDGERLMKMLITQEQAHLAFDMASLTAVNKSRAGPGPTG